MKFLPLVVFLPRQMMKVRNRLWMQRLLVLGITGFTLITWGAEPLLSVPAAVPTSSQTPAPEAPPALPTPPMPPVPQPPAPAAPQSPVSSQPAPASGSQRAIAAPTVATPTAVAPSTNSVPSTAAVPTAASGSPSTAVVPQVTTESQTAIAVPKSAPTSPTAVTAPTPVNQPVPHIDDPSSVAGTVDQVLTPDIFTVATDKGRVFVRLAGVDVPDIKQAYGKEAYKVLSNLIYKKVVIVRSVGLDPCGRVVALVWLNGDNGLDISSRLIMAGAAWVYQPYTKSDFLLKLEDDARKANKGLWALKAEDRLPPWEWRKQMRLKGYEAVSSCRVSLSDDSVDDTNDGSLGSHDDGGWEDVDKDNGVTSVETSGQTF